MKKMKAVVNVFLLVVSMSSVAQAYLVPGPGGRDRPAPYPGDRPGGGHGGGGIGPGRPHEPPYYPPSRPPYNPPYNPPHYPPHQPPHEPPYYPPHHPPHHPPHNPGYPNNPYPGNPYPGNPGYAENIEINIYRSVYGNDRIDLSQYVDLQYYRGRVIEHVRVTASARYNTGFMNLIINGRNMGQAQFNGGYSQTATYHLNQNTTIGYGADNIVLYTSGDMTVEHITIMIR